MALTCRPDHLARRRTSAGSAPGEKRLAGIRRSRSSTSSRSTSKRSSPARPSRIFSATGRRGGEGFPLGRPRRARARAGLAFAMRAARELPTAPRAGATRRLVEQSARAGTPPSSSTIRRARCASPWRSWRAVVHPHDDGAAARSRPATAAHESFLRRKAATVPSSFSGSFVAARSSSSGGASTTARRRQQRGVEEIPLQR